MTEKITSIPKAKKGLGCFFQGVATFVVMVLITIVSKETNSPAIIHWGIGMAVLYGIWGLDWKGTRKVPVEQESDTNKTDENEPPTLVK